MRNKNIFLIKQPKNKAEADFYEACTENGWKIVKRGWPDFLCFKDGEMIAVEVKKNKEKWLSRYQRFIMTELTKRGINCFRWSPDFGFQKIIVPVEFDSDPRIVINKK